MKLALALLLALNVSHLGESGQHMMRLIARLSTLGRFQKRAIVMGYDAASMLFAIWAAFSVRLDRLYWPQQETVFLIAIAAAAIALTTFYFMGVYRVVIRYLDHSTIVKLVIAAGVAAAIWFTLAHLSGFRFLPRSVGLIYWVILFGLMMLGRQVMAMFIQQGADPLPLLGDADSSSQHNGRRNIAIFGANDAGVSLERSLRGHRDYRVMFFIDDSRDYDGRTIASRKVYSSSGLAELIERHDIKEIFLAIPEAGRARRIEILELLNDYPVEVKTVPSLAELAAGRYTVSDIRPIDVNDLLSRDPVPPKMELIEQAVNGASILVTGGGGSIGSEICRQVLQQQPRKVVILDHSEYALYAIHSELLEQCEKLDAGLRPEVVPVIGSLLNSAIVQRTIADHNIDTVFHAAAYKHVPLLEDNEVVGVENNVIGTRNVAYAAVKAGVKRFTMISTDKAVRPKSVMGASKRAAELFIQAIADEPGQRTSFGIVRFGNVLDSSGSVVQRFREQIKLGGPVTVTDRDITRFFMSIPEATQLVLQASAMANRGEVFVLDMGEPVRIHDLAYSMVRLSGMTVRDAENPDGDIEVIVTGLRPGEKLYEELFVGDKIEGTSHPRINMSLERFEALKVIEVKLSELTARLENNDGAGVRAILQELTAYDDSKLAKAAE
jgi:FlaA1/EpsC-like NDP-sugar epimerase